MNGKIEPLTQSKVEEIIHALSSSNHYFKVIEIFEENGERFIRTAFYIGGRNKPFVLDQSSRVLAVASLKRYLAKDILGQVESYQCEYDYLNNKFVESSSYSSDVSNQSEKINALKQKLDEIKVFANELHIGDIEVEHLAIHDQNKRWQAKFNETIDYLIQTLSCEHS